MIVKIKDIPVEGKSFDFDLDVAKLNNRVSVTGSDPRVDYNTAKYIFFDSIPTTVHLHLDGLTVIASGNTKAKFRTSCSRCGVDTVVDLSLAINWVLKPSKSSSILPEEEEDINFGTYDGKEVCCGSFVEEQIVMSLPYTVLCKESCKGLCQYCGQNLNEKDDCGEGCRLHAEEVEGDERMAFFRNLKI